MSASVSPNNGVMLVVANGSGTAVCPAVVPQTKGTVIPQPACLPIYQPSPSVSVTVSYRMA